MKKLLLPLLLIVVSGLAAEPPVVTSKAAKELLKHPEFKKALEAAPEFTKAVLKELDKHAPQSLTKAEKDAVINLVVYGSPFLRVPLYHAKSNWPKHAVKYFDGWDTDKLNRAYWKDPSYRWAVRATTYYGSAKVFKGKKVYEAEVLSVGSGNNKNYMFYNSVLKQYTGRMKFYLDINDGKVIALGGWGTGVSNEGIHITPHGKKLGYK